MFLKSIQWIGLMVLAVLERVRQGTDLKEGQGTKNTGRVNTSDANTNARVSSCRNEIDIKTRAALGVEHSNNMAITRMQICFESEDKVLPLPPV
ncbi:hypothetical protein LEMLEM_LOCUS24752 [Lemmus lemmus]